MPHVTIPVRPGRDMARLIEVAAMDQKLKDLGQNSAVEFNDKAAQFDGDEGNVMGLLNRRANRAASDQKIEKEITIVNRLGLHARPAAMFVRIASRFRSEIWVSKRKGKRINGKSIMGLMMLAAGQGSKLRIRCEGPDAREGDGRARGADQGAASTRIDSARPE